MTIKFFKYQGTGNDFIILDNREASNGHLSTEEIKHLCDRRFGIGADGLMMLQLKEGYDFEMKYYNADGKEGSMCGNGGRCMVKFASHQGVLKTTYHFLAADGEHEAEIDLKGWVRLKMKDVNKVDDRRNDYVLDTGSPHYVKFINDVKEFDVYGLGREIRYGKEFAKKGINVNFVETIDDHSIYVRTYERGVENETFSCGTGVTASALMAAHNEIGFNEVDIITPGGNLTVEFEKLDKDHFNNIWLCGPAEFVYKGEIELKD
ncbi:MAG: diaminopimelate epimerase [Chitinophagaceae bacterium]|nr:diaminopimelate epimerase [Chitinophagaceae bacterium]